MTTNDLARKGCIIRIEMQRSLILHIKSQRNLDDLIIDELIHYSPITNHQHNTPLICEINFNECQSWIVISILTSRKVINFNTLFGKEKQIKKIIIPPQMASIKTLNMFTELGYEKMFLQRI